MDRITKEQRLHNMSEELLKRFTSVKCKALYICDLHY